jgi:hypothetical protein
VIWFPEGVNAAEIHSLDQELGGAGFERVTSYPGNIFVVRRSDKALGASWSTLADVASRVGAFEEPNYRYMLQSPPPTPTDCDFKSQWALVGKSKGLACPGEDKFCETPCTLDAAIGAIEAWNVIPTTLGAKQPVVAMIDDLPGWDDDLAVNFWKNECELAGYDDENGFPKDYYGYDAENGKNGLGIKRGDLQSAGSSKPHNHGTSVASIVAAIGNNYRGIAGLLWNGKLVLCKATKTSASLAACLKYVATLRERGLQCEGRHIDVDVVAVNVSLGGRGCSCDVEYQIRRLRELGVLIVAAAGNGGCSNGPAQPAAEPCPGWTIGAMPNCGNCPLYPAAQEVSNVISVGASSCSGAPITCSNYGRRSVHLFAPGWDIVTLVNPFSNPFSFTSAAAPHVTGVIGLLKAAEEARRSSGGSPPGTEPALEGLASAPSPTATPVLDWRWLRNRLLAGGQRFETLVSNRYPTPLARGKDSITGRYLRAWGPKPTIESGDRFGAITCKGQHVRRRVHPTEDHIPDNVSGGPPPTPLKLVKLVALDIVCETSQGPVSVEVQRQDGTTWSVIAQFSLNDDGKAPDEYEGDGEHTGTWQVPTLSNKVYKLRFWSDSPEDLSAEDLYVRVP